MKLLTCTIALVGLTHSFKADAGPEITFSENPRYNVPFFEGDVYYRYMPLSHHWESRDNIVLNDALLKEMLKAALTSKHEIKIESCEWEQRIFGIHRNGQENRMVGDKIIRQKFVNDRFIYDHKEDFIYEGEIIGTQGTVRLTTTGTDLLGNNSWKHVMQLPELLVIRSKGDIEFSANHPWRWIILSKRDDAKPGYNITGFAFASDPWRLKVLSFHDVMNAGFRYPDWPSRFYIDGVENCYERKNFK